jgi:hypothetical protein
LPLKLQNQSCSWDHHIENKSTSSQEKWWSISLDKPSSNQLLFLQFYSEVNPSFLKSSAL